MFLVFLGAPGSGKGTVAGLLKDRNHFKHVSSGVAFREIVSMDSKKSDIKKLQKILSSGELVDDKTVFEVIKAKLNEIDVKKENVILDGVPRTLVQTKLLSEYITSNNLEDVYFIYFNSDLETIKKRIAGRIVCPKCGRVYNLYNMQPKREMTCDDDGTTLIRRPEDEEDKLKIRLKEYNNKTKPLLDFYENVLVTINASNTGINMYYELTKKLNIKEVRYVSDEKND